MFQFFRFVIVGLTAVFLLSACGGAEETAVSVISPTPTSTSLPTAAATLAPTHTATATSLPTYTPSATPSPTALPTETRTPRPSATPKPTTTPEPTTTWDRYQVRTLESIKELTDPFIEESLAKYPSVYLEMSDEYRYPSQVRVIYSGEFREISADRLFAIARFFEAYLPEVADQFIPLYQHEVLVQEGNDKYWMPVQEPLIPFMHDELQIGGKASLFLTWMGAIKNGPDEVERIYLINEFQK